MLTMGELAEKAHKTAVEKGWYKMNGGKIVPRPMLSVVCLFHSEVSEVLEAYRDSAHKPEEIWFQPSGKPEGMATEIADLFIRIADTARANEQLGMRGFDAFFLQLPCAFLTTNHIRHGVDFLQHKVFRDEFGYEVGEKIPSIEMMVFTSHKYLSKYCDLKQSDDPVYWGNLQHLLMFWSVYCHCTNLPLEKAIELKMAYNSTRPHRHGNKRL